MTKMIGTIRAVLVLLLCSLTYFPHQTVSGQSSDLSAKDLWKAVREENVERVKAILAAGVEVNSRNEYGATALMFAADRGNEAIGNILLDAGADPQIQDTFYNSTPVAWALYKGHKRLTLAMLAKSTDLADSYLLSAINSGDSEWAGQILARCQPSQAGLIKAREAAIRKSQDKKFEALPQLFERCELPPFAPPAALSESQRRLLLGKYRGDSLTAEVKLDGDVLQLGFSEESVVTLEHLKDFQFNMNGAEVTFSVEENRVSQLTVVFGDSTILFKPLADSLADSEKGEPEKIEMTEPAEGQSQFNSPPSPRKAPSPPTEAKPKFGPSSEASLAADRSIASPNWPSFRGTGARGVAEGQRPPIQWNVDEDPAKQENVKWIAPVPGLGLSSPVIWGDQLFVTSAVSEAADNQLRIGLYGDVDSVNEDVQYDFVLYCFDKNSGKLNWSQVCHSAKPSVKRHAKSSHANPSVATNGDRVVAFFASEGLFCFSHDGELQWKKDFGVLDSGWFYDASYQWGFGSSPILFEDKVIVQCDIQEGSFIAALDLATGAEVWRTEREEIPGWSTPTIHQFGELAMLLTHATKAARGYDARTGELLWSLAKHSEIVVPTPFVAHDLIFIASGYSPIQPIVAIRPTARGDISLPSGVTESDDVAWSTLRHGPYMPTPIVYGDYLYVCGNSGVLACYRAPTGEEVYRKRMAAKGGSLAFTASPLAADGHLYFAAEDGRVLVVKAGPEYELVATNPSGGSILSTPAISEGVFYIRTENQLIALERTN